MVHNMIYNMVYNMVHNMVYNMVHNMVHNMVVSSCVTDFGYNLLLHVGDFGDRNGRELNWKTLLASPFVYCAWFAPSRRGLGGRNLEKIYQIL
jgi:hypothetical protein